MQVVVLAGGMGTRLRPWTWSTPKPALPMLDRTLIEQVVGTFGETIVEEVILAGGYMIEELRTIMGYRDLPFRLTIAEEHQPLGTGGALRNCKEHIRGPFVCFNGDIISSLDPSKLLEAMTRHGGIGALGLWTVKDPSRFGIVHTEGEIITGFSEKPHPRELLEKFRTTGGYLINAGSYAFQPTIFDHLPDGPHSLERHVFPRLASDGALSGVPFDGRFIDAGVPSAWLDATAACIADGRFVRGTRIETSWFESDAHDGVESSAIHAGVSIGARAIVERSYVLEDVSIGRDSIVRNSLIGAGARIGSRCILNGVTVGYGASIPDDTTLQGDLESPVAWPPGSEKMRPVE